MTPLSRAHSGALRVVDVAPILAVGALAFASSSPVFAAPTVANCYGLHAPSSHSSESCNSTCSVESIGILGYKAICDVDDYIYADGQITAVLDYEGTGSTVYSAWGRDTNGDEFCCAIHDSAKDVGFFYLYGSYVSDDELAFQYSSHSMGTPDGNDFLAFAYGSHGDDEIVGSNEEDTSYEEYLFGGYGADYIYGGDGDDHICGGPGSGSAHYDFLAGEGGDDVIIALCGGNSLRGGGGTNVMCGFATDGTANAFYGSALGTNVFFQRYSIYGATPTGVLFGGTGYCGHPSWGSSWATGCTYNVSSEPTECTAWSEC